MHDFLRKPARPSPRKVVHYQPNGDDSYSGVLGNAGHDTKFYEPDFLQDMQDMFAYRRHGHAFHHVMRGPAFAMWEQFTRAADTKYYPFNEEAELIQSNPDWFRIQAGLSVGEGSLVAEMGTGSEHSAYQKTLPLLEAVNASVYVGIDKSVTSAMAVVETVRRERPEKTAAYIRLTDFNKSDFKIRWDELGDPQTRTLQNQNLIPQQPLPDVEPRRRILVQFGSTIANIEGYLDDAEPIEEVVSYMKNYRANMREGDTFFLGVDQNQDEDSLKACYGSPIIEQFSMAMLEDVRDSLPNAWFDPDNFQHVGMWNKKNGLYFNGFTTLRDNVFSLGGEIIYSPKNGKMSYVNSWKLKQRFWERAARESGFQHKDMLVGPGNRIHIHALRAV